MRLLTLPVLAASAITLTGCATFGALFGGPAGQVVGKALDFAFELAAPHLEAVVNELPLDASLKGAVKGLIHGKGIADTVMDLVRPKVPAELASVLDGIRGGLTAAQALAGPMGLAAIEKSAPAMFSRWKDFSGHVEQVESTMSDVATAFNTGDLDTVLPLLAYPYREDDKVYASADELKRELGPSLESLGAASMLLNVDFKAKEHMPAEAFVAADRLADLPVAAGMQQWAKDALGGDPGFVSLVTVGVSAPTVAETKRDTELFVTKKVDGRFRLVATALVGDGAGMSSWQPGRQGHHGLALRVLASVSRR